MVSSNKNEGRRRRFLSGFSADERGSVTVLAALSMAALLGLFALSIDLGALFNARSEAQRAADAAALAGASAFLDYQQEQARRVATDRAVEYAITNEIRNQTIDSEEVSVWVNLDSATVRAAIRRNGLEAWFAKLVGIETVDIGAEATAWAGAAGAASCVKPFAVPDLWEERTDDTNGNRVWDEGESWDYDPGSGDRYDGYTGFGGGANETGYGSDWRDGRLDDDGRRYDGDYGRQITLKVTNPRDAFVSSFFFPWVLPEDSDQEACGSGPPGGGNRGEPDIGGGGGPPTELPGGNDGSVGWLKWTEKRGDLGAPSGNGRGGGNGNGGGGNGGGGGAGGGGGSVDVERDSGRGRGAAAYRQNICSCNNSVIDLDTEYLIEPGNMVGPTFQGVESLIAQDPDAYWDESSGQVVSQYGMDSPRVVTVALFDPGEINKPGRQYIRFNNFARVFIEEQADRRDPVTGRFLYYVPGVGSSRSGSTTGSLVRVLQLIK